MASLRLGIRLAARPAASALPLFGDELLAVPRDLHPTRQHATSNATGLGTCAIMYPAIYTEVEMRTPRMNE